MPPGCGGALPEVNRKGDDHYCKNNGTLSRRNGSQLIGNVNGILRLVENSISLTVITHNLA
ncbi:hypothetical protein QTP88_003760 [Uroleucon formosanum]